MAFSALWWPKYATLVGLEGTQGVVGEYLGAPCGLKTTNLGQNSQWINSEIQNGSKMAFLALWWQKYATFGSLEWSEQTRNTIILQNRF